MSISWCILSKNTLTHQHHVANISFHSPRFHVGVFIIIVFVCLCVCVCVYVSYFSFVTFNFIYPLYVWILRISMGFEHEYSTWCIRKTILRFAKSDRKRAKDVFFSLNKEKKKKKKKRKITKHWRMLMVMIMTALYASLPIALCVHIYVIVAVFISFIVLSFSLFLSLALFAYLSMFYFDYFHTLFPLIYCIEICTKSILWR